MPFVVPWKTTPDLVKVGSEDAQQSALEALHCERVAVPSSSKDDAEVRQSLACDLASG